jgi:CheY-like chemotaxis protein
MRQPAALVIDDCQFVREAMVDSLMCLGYEATPATDGRQGLEAFALHHYDLVVTDLQMPGINGYEVASRLRQARPDVAVLIVSGTFLPDTVKARSPLGRLEMLAKPFSLEQLKAAIDRVTAADTVLPGQRAA